MPLCASSLLSFSLLVCFVFNPYISLWISLLHKELTDLFHPRSVNRKYSLFLLSSMGNKPAKQEHDVILVKVVPPLDHAYVRWLARDVERLHGFTPKNPRTIKPPENVIEYMQLYGWLDLDINDPDLAPLFR